jgi:SAM-dependent methyltransferase
MADGVRVAARIFKLHLLATRHSRNMNHRETVEPSPWVTRWAGLVPAGGRMLDLACGNGRHARYFAARGHPVEAVDRDADALASLAGLARIHTRCADLESGPWPCTGERFDGIVVANYLHRPLFPYLLASLAAGGILIYETFAQGNERYGKPSNPHFLFRPGELLELCRGRLRVIAYEDVTITAPKPAAVQRICAINAQ